MLTLAQALRCSKTPRIAFVGGGGKTTAMFRLAQEMAPAIVTTSTHIRAWQADKADRHFIWEDGFPMPDIEGQLGNGITLLTGNLDKEKERYLNLTPPQLDKLLQLSNYHDLPLLIEADGSRQKPIKAPADHEPAIPSFVDLVVVVAGLSGIGKPLNEYGVHRPQIFSLLSGLQEGEIVTPMALARVLTHPAGGLKNIPPQARRVVMLNQANSPISQAQANETGQALLPVFDGVLVTVLNAPHGFLPGPIIAVKENIAGIILAAGASSRYGKPKQLLDYHGKPFVSVVAETALRAGLAKVIVVTGAHASGVTPAVEDMHVTIVHNPNWEDGQSTSIKAGMSQMDPETGGAIFLLADQPQVSVELLRALVERHSQDLPSVLAPYVFDQRANPLLFDRVTFPDLFTIQGDTGGRAILSKFSPRYVNWYDRRLLLDVDTPDDYQNLIEGENNNL
jgi:molybdenum cofactor cytidylyltransferase